jgi:hypothetical protein
MIPDERSKALKRKWRMALRTTQAEAVKSWPQAIREARAQTDDQLRAATQGCNELTCVQHGALVQVLRDRGAAR